MTPDVGTERVPESAAVRSGESLQSLERGIAVLRIFSRDYPALTLSEVARLVGIARATARRILLTLECLGYVRSDGRMFMLTPRVLDLGWSYLSSLNMVEFARPLVQDLAKGLDESCWLGTLDLPDIVYLAHVPGRHVMTVSGRAGNRLPAHATALGQVLLAALEPAELDDYLATVTLHPYTRRTVTDEAAFRAVLRRTANRGWALADQELELGLRSVAAPIADAGRVVAGIAVAAASARVTLDDLRTRCLPELLRTAQLISTALTQGAGHAAG